MKTTNWLLCHVHAYELQIRRGNPNLKAYLRYHTELTYEWQKGIFYSNLWGAYDYQPNAIMDEK